MSSSSRRQKHKTRNIAAGKKNARKYVFTKVCRGGTSYEQGWMDRHNNRWFFFRGQGIHTNVDVKQKSEKQITPAWNSVLACGHVLQGVARKVLHVYVITHNPLPKETAPHRWSRTGRQLHRATHSKNKRKCFPVVVIIRTQTPQFLLPILSPVPLTPTPRLSHPARPHTHTQPKKNKQNPLMHTHTQPK